MLFFCKKFAYVIFLQYLCNGKILKTIDMELLKHAWEWFNTQVSSALLVNAIVALIFWFFGFLGRKLLDWIRSIMLKVRNEEIKDEYMDSIVPFDIVSPCYAPELANMRLLKNRFVFEIPEQKRKELAAQKSITGEQKFAIHEPAKLDGDNHDLYKFLLRHYSKRFPDAASVDTFLNEKIASTADYFIERLQQGKLAFNNRQIGIDHIDIYRQDKEAGKGEEKQVLDLDLYETDYFTAQVMVHVYQYLRQLDAKYKKNNPEYSSPFDQINTYVLNNEMRPFMSSLGVGGYIIFDRGQGLEYWTVQRSENVRNGSNKNMELRSYSFDETMDLKDRIEDISDSSTISAYVGANRAIQEELGLFTKKDERVRGAVGDFHMTGLILIRTDDSQNARFEMQLLGYTFVHFNDNFTYNDLILKKRNAQDSSFEAVVVYANKLKDRLVGIVEGSYTHTPESVYYAETLRNMEDRGYIHVEYKDDTKRR